MRLKRSIKRYFIPTRTAVVDEEPQVLNSVVSMFTGACVSGVIASVFYHLSVIDAFDRFQSLMGWLGRVLLPGSQTSHLTSGSLGFYAGIVACYFVVFVAWWLADLRVGMTIEHLPGFMLIACIISATLAWKLFFPWISLE